MQPILVDPCVCPSCGRQPPPVEEVPGRYLECPECQKGFCVYCSRTLADSGVVIKNNDGSANTSHMFCPNRACNALLEIPKSKPTRTFTISFRIFEPES
jgi:hypothetical protein